MKSNCAALCSMLMLGWSQYAFALDERVLATARDLGAQGLSDYDAGRYEQAAQKLQQAYGAVRVPTFARNAARALAKQGKLVAAAELYLEATRLEPNELWRGDLQQQAQRECQAEREALLTRVARVKIAIEGADAKDVRVELDGVTVPQTLLGSELFADPGLRRLVGKRREQAVEQSIVLKEGEHAQTVLRFTPAAATAPAAPATIDERSNTPALRRTLGWVGVGVGAAGVTLGAITGVLALSKRSELRDAGCSDNECTDRNLRGKMDSYNSTLDVSTVGFVVGGVAAAAGVTLLLWPEHRAPASKVGFVLSPGSLSLQGKF